MTEEEARKELELDWLKEEYNAALKRYNKMIKWCETATVEQQEKQYKHIVEVINNCNGLLNKINLIDPLVTPGEILNGFREVI